MFNEMARDPTELLKAAMELSVRERAQLVALLLESLDGEPKEDVEAAWRAELERRAKQAMGPEWLGDDASVVLDRTRPKK